MIILTGASGGLGQAIRKDLLKIDELQPISYKNGLEFDNKVDLSNSKDIKRFVDYWKTKLHRITVVHLAALNFDGLATSYEEAWWDEVMNVNLKGNFLLTKALLPTMISDHFGRIIHISSIGMGNIGTIAYSTAKSALTGMSKVLAREYARYGITSNILQLGYFGSGLFNKFTEEKKKEAINKIPNKQLGNTKNIVNAIEFLIKSDYVNGATIAIDGGV